MNQVKKDPRGKTSLEIQEDVILFYDPNASQYYIEDYRHGDSIYHIVLKDEILDMLYNKAWSDDE